MRIGAFFAVQSVPPRVKRLESVDLAKIAPHITHRLRLRALKSPDVSLRGA